MRYAKIMPYFQDGKPWGDYMCAELARAGGLAALMLAHAHGCKWNCSVVINACMHGNMDCLQFALKNGCPGKEIACLAIAGWAPFLEYIREPTRGFTWEQRFICYRDDEKRQLLS